MTNLKAQYWSNNKTPHCLIELSKRQFCRMKDNMIILNDPLFKFNKIQYKSPIMTYKNYTVGKNISFIENKDQCHAQSFNIECIKNKYVVLVGVKSELKKIHPNPWFFNTLHDLQGPNEPGSGYIVLLFAMQDNAAHEGNEVWNTSHQDMLKFSKPNVLGKGKDKHFGSEGSYYSFGNKGSFRIENNSSVSQYSTKKSTSESSMGKIIRCSDKMEEFTAAEIKLSLMSIARYFSKINLLLMPVLHAGNELQKEFGDIGLQNVKTSRSGVWQSQVCVNATTKEFHIEIDCSYTLISVPKQKIKKNHLIANFYFKIQEETLFSIRMKPDVKFMFSGYYLTHRQESKSQKEDDTLFNVAAYSNNRMFSHIRKSFHRANK